MPIGPIGEDLRSYFYLSQVLVGVGFIVLLFFKSQRPSSGFFNQDSNGNSKPRRRLLGKPDPLAEARRKPKPEPLRLPGISLSGAAHEILGVRKDADLATIQKAYRDLMKRYHPDLVGRPGSREWKDAQKIAEALNRAKEEMSKHSQSQSPKRSAR